MTRRYKLVIAYDGTNYSGYQLQENAVSVQQVLEEALTYLDRAPVRVFGCSRTDAGVHARGFVAHCDLVQPIPPAKLVYAMNARMPQDVRVLRASLAAADFDARKSAIGKEYRYFVYNAPILPPHLAPYWTGVPQQLDVAAMQDGAARFVGKHDFVSFAANPRRELHGAQCVRMHRAEDGTADCVVGARRRFPLQAGALDDWFPSAHREGRRAARGRIGAS